MRLPMTRPPPVRTTPPPPAFWRFRPARRPAVISVEIIDDLDDESDESFALSLSDPVNAVLGEAGGLCDRHSRQRLSSRNFLRGRRSDRRRRCGDGGTRAAGVEDEQQRHHGRSSGPPTVARWITRTISFLRRRVVIPAGETSAAHFGRYRRRCLSMRSTRSSRSASTGVSAEYLEARPRWF